jgi:hypothetical protein
VARSVFRNVRRQGHGCASGNRGEHGGQVSHHFAPVCDKLVRLMTVPDPTLLEKLAQRLAGLDIDGLIIYDIQDEAQRMA